MPTKPKKQQQQAEKDITFWNGQFRASVGYEVKGDDGPVHDLKQIALLTPDQFAERRKPKVWMLGADIRVARPYLTRIKGISKLLKEGGVQNLFMAGTHSRTEARLPEGWKQVWTASALQAVRQDHADLLQLLTTHDADEAQFRQLEAEQPEWVKRNLPAARTALPTGSGPSGHESNAHAPEGRQDGFTLAAAVDAYGVKLDADVLAGDRSQSNATRQMISLKEFLRFIADQPYNPAEDPKLPKQLDKQVDYFKAKFSQPSPVASRGIRKIGYDQIGSFVCNIKQRRVSGYKPVTIHFACQHVAGFLGWTEDRYHFQFPFNYSRLLKVKAARLYTPAEQKQMAKGQPVHTPDELATLWTHANENQRLYMILGLNLVAAQQTLADLMHEDLYFDDKPPHVQFIRGKTRASANGGQGIEVRYDLWPLAAKLLRARVKTTPANDAGLALLTEDGFPLVRSTSGPKGKSKTDSVAQSWKRLLATVNETKQVVRPLGFKYLRKTMADWVKRLEGEAVQQLALAQSRKSVAAKHYSGADDFDVMNTALKTIWAELEPKFDAAVKKLEADRQVAKQTKQAAYQDRQRVAKKNWKARQRELVTSSPTGTRSRPPAR